MGYKKADLGKVSLEKILALSQLIDFGGLLGKIKSEPSSRRLTMSLLLLP